MTIRSLYQPSYQLQHHYQSTSLVMAAWWRHQMETFSALLAICAGNSPVSGEFPAQRPVTRSFDVFFDVRVWVNTREAGDLRRYRIHYDVIVMVYPHVIASVIIIVWPDLDERSSRTSGFHNIASKKRWSEDALEEIDQLTQIVCYFYSLIKIYYGIRSRGNHIECNICPFIYAVLLGFVLFFFIS